jgi:hypothetical protein
MQNGTEMVYKIEHTVGYKMEQQWGVYYNMEQDWNTKGAEM